MYNLGIEELERVLLSLFSMRDSKKVKKFISSRDYHITTTLNVNYRYNDIILSLEKLYIVNNRTVILYKCKDDNGYSAMIEEAVLEDDCHLYCSLYSCCSHSSEMLKYISFIPLPSLVENLSITIFSFWYHLEDKYQAQEATGYKNKNYISFPDRKYGSKLTKDEMKREKESIAYNYRIPYPNRLKISNKFLSIPLNIPPPNSLYSVTI